jgi:hypothetical protein
MTRGRPSHARGGVRGCAVRVLVVGVAATLLALTLARPVRGDDPPGSTPSSAVEAPPAGEDASALSAETAPASGRLSLTGSLAVDARGMRSPAAPGGESSARADLYIRKIELAVEAPMLRGVNAIAVVNSEWIGDGMSPGAAGLAVDEAHLDLGGKHAYLVVGQRTQPFGVFESHLVTDPLTQDAYEIKKPGATLGVRGPLGTDVSLTIYAGGALWDHFTSSHLIDGAALNRQASVANRVSSYVLAAALSPWGERVGLSGAFDSEPGQGRRNTTANVALHLVPHGSKHLIVDAEVVRALSRESPPGAARAFKETAGSLSVAYVFVVRPRKMRGNGSYKARMAHIRAHPILVCARHEFLDDGGLTAAWAVATVRQRTSLGGRYTLHDGNGRSVYASSEYRRTAYRVRADASPSERRWGNEVYLRLGINF